MDIQPKFTPGPYRIEEDAKDEPVIVGRPNWTCKRFGVHGEWDVARIDDLLGDHPEEVAANARLFAASHELFWFVVRIAQSDPAFAKGREKDRINEARHLVQQVLA